MSSISARAFLLWKEKQLSKGGDNESLDLLIELIGGINRNDINLCKINSDRTLYLKKKLNEIEFIWEDFLLNSVPIQYLCGYVFWRDIKLSVSEKVLIPRSETEILVDTVLKIFEKNDQKLVFAELGTGSGAISIALALARPLWEGIATDIDKNAIEIASKNFKNYSDKSNLRFLCGHWWKPLENFKGKLDFVISNPPYIPKIIFEKLPKEVKNFEPEIALLGGEDGLLHIKEIIRYAPLFLKEKGWILLENHFDQGLKVKQLLLKSKFTSVKVLKDFRGIGRFTIGRYK